MIGFPLLLIPLAIYNIIVFLMPDVSFADPLVKLTLMSGAEWPVTLSDVLLALGILMLLSEVIKGARPGAKYLTDHLLSLIVFGARRRRIRAVAEIRHLDLFPADAAGAGGFPVGPCAANAARRRSGVCAPPISRRGRRKGRGGGARTPVSSRHVRAGACSRPRLSPNPCCWIAPSRKSCIRERSRRRTRPRRRCPSSRDCSRATVSHAVAGHAALTLAFSRWICRVRMPRVRGPDLDLARLAP